MDKWIDQVAVVTGASSGIGAAIARKLVESGVNVVGLARRVELIEELSNELTDQPAKLYAIKCNLTSENSIIDAYDWIKSNVGSISILVNNAGVIKPTTLIDGDTNAWRETFDVNVLGLCICTREALKSMKDAEIDGHIIHVNSVVGHQVFSFPEPLMNVYPASKFAVTALTETLRQDLRYSGTKIKVTSISPGLLATEIRNNFPDAVQEAVQQMPFLEPEDIANAVNYVLSTPPHVQVSELTIKPIGELF